MDPELIPAGPSDIPVIRELAGRIWRAHYPGIITPEQIEYMLARMYAPGTLRVDMDAGARFLLARAGGKPVGYLAWKPAPDGAALLEKLYLLPEHHGTGWGRLMLARVIGDARAGGARRLDLYVNKANAKAIRAYGKAGFAIAEAVVKDIGGGFVMDDYRMSLALG